MYVGPTSDRSLKDEGVEVGGGGARGGGGWVGSLKKGKRKKRAASVTVPVEQAS